VAVRIALGTNRYVDFCKGDPDAVQAIREANRIFLPLIVLGELRAGFLAGSRSRENEEILARFLNSPRVEVLSPDEQTSHHYARLFLQLRRQGTPIPTNDLWVAALVVQHELILCDRDRHFDHLPQLARLL
jgi:tRNA(fMet)-specific endonuclease VapC